MNYSDMYYATAHLKEIKDKINSTSEFHRWTNDEIIGLGVLEALEKISNSLIGIMEKLEEL